LRVLAQAQISQRRLQMMTLRLVALAMWCVGLSVLSASTVLVLILAKLF
jgi:hypothetical protein